MTTNGVRSAGEARLEAFAGQAGSPIWARLSLGLLLQIAGSPCLYKAMAGARNRTQRSSGRRAE